MLLSILFYDFLDSSGVKIGDMTNTAFSNPRFNRIRLSNRTRTERWDTLKAGYGNFDLVGTSTFGSAKNTLLLYGFKGETWAKTIGVAAIYPGLDFTNPIYFTDPAAKQGPIAKNIDQTIKSSVYAYAFQDNLSFLNDRLIFVAGARYDNANSTNLNRINNANVFNDVRTGTSRKFGVVGRPIAPVSLYYNYSETFSPNGFDQITGDKLANQIPKNNEFGTKLNLFKDQLIVSYAYFETVTENALLPVTVIDSAGASRLVNRPAGSLVVKGWESDATWAINQNVAMLFGAGNLKSKTATGFLSRAVPQGFNYKFFGKYTFTQGPMKGAFGGFGYEHNSERALANSDTPLMPSYNTADLLLGYLDAKNYAGGSIPLNARRASAAIEDTLCDELDCSVIEAALMIREKVDANMANGLFTELRARGYDPKEFTMLAYGGNGPLHGCGIARNLGIDKILAPPLSSVFSAVGAGNMHQLHIHEQSLYMVLYDSNTRNIFEDYPRFNSIVADLKEQGTQDLLRQGIARGQIQHRLELDMRYGNQLVTTTAVISEHEVHGPGDVLSIISQFSNDYGKRFGEGSQAPEAGIRINTMRVAAFVEHETIVFEDIKPVAAGLRTAPPPPESVRKCHFVGHEGPLDTPVWNRSAIEPGVQIAGPAIVASEVTTFLVDPGWNFVAARQGASWFLRANAT